MRIGVPKEVKDHEDRVGLVPSSVAELVHHGHQVIVEKGAGIGSGLSDAEYTSAGATLHDGPEAIFSLADMIVKVKEPLPSERKLLRSGQVLFTYLHLAADLDLTRDLLSSGATCIAYETVSSPTGTLPLLTPMSGLVGSLLKWEPTTLSAPKEGAGSAWRGAGSARGGGRHSGRRRLRHSRGGDCTWNGGECRGGRPFRGGAEKDRDAVRFPSSHDLFNARYYPPNR